MTLPVAFFLPHLDAGGIERIVLNLLLHLDRSRFKPILILRRPTGTLLPQVPRDVEIHDLGGRRASLALPRLATCLRQTGARVLYSGTCAANLVAVPAAKLAGTGVAVIASEHTPPGIFLEEAKWRHARIAAMRFLYPRAATIAVPVAEIGDELRHLLGKPDLSVTVLPNPVYDATLSSRKEETPEVPLPPKPNLLLVSTGRMVNAKGFDILLRAFARVKPLPHPLNLMLLGDGPERQNLEELATTLGIADNVQFAGTVDNPYAILSRAAVAVQASRREGFGNVLVEAMACGAPVIAADCPFGPRILLKKGEVGLLVPPEDPGALAEAIERLLKDKTMAAGMRRRGLEKAKEFAADRTVPLFQDLFEALAFT